MKHVVNLPSLHISLPISNYFDEPVVDINALSARICLFTPPPSWIVDATKIPIIVCKCQTSEWSPPRVVVLMTLPIKEELNWEIPFIHSKLIPQNCPLP